MINLLELTQNLENTSSEDPLFLEKCTEISKEIAKGVRKIADVVTGLEHLLVNVVVVKRVRGVEILTTILEKLPLDYLSSEELHYLVTFYKDRLRDHHTVLPSTIRGLLATTRMASFSAEDVSELLAGVFQHIPCQQQQAAERRRVYEMMLECWKREDIRTVIKNMGGDFVLGLMNSMDGERDPRNLLIIFNWLPKILPDLTLGQLAEDMFDVISCYFPVDFRPPASADLPPEQQVTREQLAEGLNACMCASPDFAQFCVPLLLEKMDSALLIAKLDSLNLLRENCTGSSTNILQSESSEIWSRLQRESLTLSSEKEATEVREAALKAATAMAALLPSSPSIRNTCDALFINLRPDNRLFTSSARLLCAIAQAHPTTRRQVLTGAVPPLIQQYISANNPEQQLIVFETLLTIAEVCVCCEKNDLPLLEQVWSVCLGALCSGHAPLRKSAWRAAANTVHSYSSAPTTMLLNALTANVRAPQPTEVREEILKSLTIVTRCCGEEVLQQIVPEDLDGETNVIQLQLHLEALCAVIPEYPKLLKRLVKCCCNTNLSTVAFGCLNQLLNNTQNPKLINFLYKDYGLLNSVVDFVTNVELNEELLEDISAVCKLVIGEQNCETQSIIVSNYLSKLLELVRLRSDTVIVLEGFLSRLRRDVDVPNKFSMLLEVLCLELKDAGYRHVCYLAAGIINKSEEGDELNATLAELDRRIQEATGTSNCEKAIALHGWITKSLLAKGSSQADQWTDSLIAMLDKHPSALNNITIVMQETDYLTTKSNCIIRLLYKQRFFTRALSRLAESKSEVSLAAVGELLGAAPLPAVRAAMPRAWLLAAHCLDACARPSALIGALTAINSLLETRDPIIIEQIDELLSRLLIIATNNNSMRVRSVALGCVRLLANAPLLEALPHKQTVLMGLIPCLDDRKRLVRKEAVAARTAWFLLDAPT